MFAGAVKQFGAFCGTWRFIIILPLVPNLSHTNLDCTHRFYLRCILTSSDLFTSLRSCRFSSVFPAKTIHAFIISPMHATRLAYLILLYLFILNNVWRTVRIMGPLLLQIPPFSWHFIPLHTNIPFSIVIGQYQLVFSLMWGVKFYTHVTDEVQSMLWVL